VTYVNYGGAIIESVDPVAVTTGVFGLYLGLREGFEGDGEELFLCSKV